MIELQNEIASLKSEVSQLKKATDAWKAPNFVEESKKAALDDNNSSKIYFWESLPSSDVWCRGTKRFDR
jgi:hypothetical protein